MSAIDTPTTASAPGAAAGGGLRYLISDSLVLARRRAAHIRQIPEKLLDVTLQPIMFVLLFAYVFGGVIHVPGGAYKDYLIGGILIQTLTFGLMGPGMSICADLSEGILDRFRSLPSSRFAFLYGHMIAEFAASMLALTILTLSGLVIGWRIHSDVPHAIAGFALLATFSFTMLWLGTFLGMLARSTDAVQGIVFMFVFPLTFVSNVFVPAGGLPSALKTVAQWNPISALSAGVRTLFGNPTALPKDPAWPLRHPVLASVLWCGVLLAVIVPLALARYRTRTSG
jgi:ABC-2 type transport system permease protein